MSQQSRRGKRERRNFVILVSPALFIFSLVIIVPFFLGLYYSFTNWGGIIKPVTKMVGFENYIQAFKDTRFQYSLLVTAIFAIINVLVVNAIAFGLALLVSSELKFKNAYRAGFFVPNLIGGLVLGYIWQFVFNNVFPNLGKVIGSEFLVNNLFLGNPRLAVMALVITNTWQYAGYIMMIYFAALQNVPKSLTEAASLDGANWWFRLRHITIPMIMPAFTVSLFLTINNSFKMFDVNFSLTGGGPSMLWANQAIKSTEFITMNIYNTASLENQMARGQARAIILFVILVVISITQTTITKRKEVEM
ncbi:sugar ABC transporter permease [Aerococcaceae bacterium zg-ZJ1578]|uniref:carbohydrate ABC transporter permease n=1 Tax=Aerococcaceae TaxID=186827 RepID=UPI0013BA4B44|nr:MULTISPECIES: sugar ABC transporter permease [unclassified Facklamia]MBK0347018.1 sugar ABC transporter permease [Aerococcaceae bacterium zg-1578]MBR7927431.1 sugar ABC transporter permease [Aerococcaceae bacterium zg-ZUI334]MBS4461258.1 sugar ABC transporter permease [Aerococcaceae bacterium zg-B36]QQD65964.1 sugar ABC transporter permease [Aerococcaceae bacterium zg-252]NEW65162.1 ABC transporter permease subunit [Facklamia sp. 252]